MRTQSPDTSPEIERIQIGLYRKMTAAQKLRIIADLNRLARNLALANIRKCHPDADEQECMARYAARCFPAELVKRAYRWDPAARGD